MKEELTRLITIIRILIISSMLITLQGYAVQDISYSLYANSTVHVGQANEVDNYKGNIMSISTSRQLYFWFRTGWRIRRVWGRSMEKQIKLNKQHHPSVNDVDCTQKAYDICTKKYTPGTNDHFICYSYVYNRCMQGLLFEVKD